MGWDFVENFVRRPCSKTMSCRAERRPPIPIAVGMDRAAAVSIQLPSPDRPSMAVSDPKSFISIAPELSSFGATTRLAGASAGARSTAEDGIARERKYTAPLRSAAGASPRHQPTSLPPNCATSFAAVNAGSRPAGVF